MKRTLLHGFLSIVILAFLSACDSDNEKNARVQVWLTDAPGDYEAVNIDIQGIEVHASENDNEKGWTSLPTNTGIYNLLELTNGIDTLLAETEIPAGKISQIRLKLGERNTVKIGDAVLDLDIPSGQQSGLKLQVHETLSEGIVYKILLDFDVARSIVQTGELSYKLKPVIRMITAAQTGAIKGEVSPVEANPAVYAIQGTDTLGTTYCDSTGHFLLRGIPAGTYNVTFAPAAGYAPVEKSPVTVQTGVVTDIGEVLIPEL